MVSHLRSVATLTTPIVSSNTERMCMQTTQNTTRQIRDWDPEFNKEFFFIDVHLLD